MANPEGRTILIGSKNSDHVEITSDSREQRSDRTVIYATMRVAGDPWRGEWRTEFANIELEPFAAELQSLYERLDATIKFNSWEGDLAMVFQGDGRGHIKIEGVARKVSSFDNAQGLRILIDQTQLPALIKSIKQFAAD